MSSACAEYKEAREISIIGMQQATSKEYGQELHVIAKRYRGEDWKIIGHYMNLNLSVRSEYNFSGSSFYKKALPTQKW